MEDRGASELEARETEAKTPGAPGVVVFEVATAGRVGLQLRYSGGPRLNEIRYAEQLLTMRHLAGEDVAGLSRTARRGAARTGEQERTECGGEWASTLASTARPPDTFSPTQGSDVTESEKRRADLLEWLYDYRGEQPGAMPAVVDFLDGEPDEHTEELWRGTLRGLKRDGLIILAESYGFGGVSALITDRGRAAVEAWRQHQAAEREAQERRRADPALRRAAATNGLLRWAYGQDPDGTKWLYVDQFLSSAHSLYEGERLPEDLVRRAALNLQENELVRGDKGVAEIEEPIVVQITPLGQDCIESGGDVASYLRQRHERATNITNFHGPVSGNVTWDSTHVTQTATTTGMAGDELAALVRAIAEAVPVLGLSEEHQAAVRRNVEVIEGELGQPEPDQHTIKNLMRRTVDVIGGTANSALGLLLSGYAKELMRSAGIPIG